MTNYRRPIRARPIAKLIASSKLRPPVDYGLSLEHKERSRLEADMATDPYLTHFGFRVLVRLLRSTTNRVIDPGLLIRR